MRKRFYRASQAWSNGTVVSSELWADGNERYATLRIQGEQENMLCDIEIGEMEALAIINVLSAAITKGNAEMTDAQNDSESVLQ